MRLAGPPVQAVAGGSYGSATALPRSSPSFDAERGAQGIESMPPMLLSLSVAGLALSVWAPGGLTLAVPSWLLSAPLWCAVLLLLLLLRCLYHPCLLYTSPSPRDQRGSRMPSSA